jgi:hypothetical protein
MSETIYVLCALTSFACAWLLLQSYRKSGYRLLFWSGLCFSVMTINNLILVADKLIFPSNDLSHLRQISALIAVLLLLYGLIYEKE